MTWRYERSAEEPGVVHAISDGASRTVISQFNPMDVALLVRSGASAAGLAVAPSCLGDGWVITEDSDMTLDCKWLSKEDAADLIIVLQRYVDTGSIMPKEEGS